MDRRSHWEGVYRTKAPDEVSWFQAEATLSLRLIREVAPARDAAILDVGAGASVLLDGLLADGYGRITALDLSAAALERTRARVPDAPTTVEWRVGDVLAADLPAAAFDVWHDRAVFHFLVDAADRARYVARLRHALRPGGHAIVATFAEDGPTRCSGLDVTRYSATALHAALGDDFRLVDSGREEHDTPWGARQPFTWCVCRHEPRPPDGGTA